MPFQVPTPPAPIVLQVQKPKANYGSTPTSEIYTYGTTLLRNGSQFEKAIAALEEVVRREPKGFRPRVMLACAYASRAAVLSSAVTQMRFRGPYSMDYEKRFKEWQDAQKDRRNPLYKTPRPTLHIIVTKDDRRPISRPPSEVLEEAVRLAKDSLDSILKAQSLTSGDSKKQEECQYTLGWMLFLLYQQDALRIVTGDVSVTPEEITGCFQKSVEASPANADSWQSLGLSLTPAFVATKKRTKDECSQAKNAFDKAIQIVGASANLYLQASLTTEDFDTDLSVAYLKKAASIDSSNATLLYALGLKLLLLAKQNGKDEERFKAEGLTAVNAGNAPSVYEPRKVVVPVPAPLRFAWYSTASLRYGNETKNINSLIGALQSLAKQQSQQEDHPKSVETAVSLVNFGLHITQSSEEQWNDMSSTEAVSFRSLRQILGKLAVDIGDSLLRKQFVYLPETVSSRKFLEEISFIKNNLSEVIQKNPNLRISSPLRSESKGTP